MAISENLAAVTERMRQAALRCGRNPGEIRLVAVSKTVSPEKIREAINAGVTILGENYIQEARKKIEEIGGAIEWHFIGHLQSNKVKYAVDLFTMIHSVDSVSLAEELNRAAEKRNKIIPVLVQVNISGEETKSGINPEETARLLTELSSMDRLSVRGLMTMPPWFENAEDARPYFAALRNLRDELSHMNIKNITLRELSMGMSGDFEVAIEEGATLVRVGTALFGPRR